MPNQVKDKEKKVGQDSTANPPSGDRLEPDDTQRRPVDVPQETEANRHEQLSEEAAVVPYYNNFFTTYRLGPEDVISVVVFNQDRYSRSGIVVPPSGRISLSLIPGGIFVNGRTVEEVAELIKKKYDEYIIDPQVTVSLDKASSYRYSVIGRGPTRHSFDEPPNDSDRGIGRSRRRATDRRQEQSCRSSPSSQRHPGADCCKRFGHLQRKSR